MDNETFLHDLVVKLEKVAERVDELNQCLKSSNIPNISTALYELSDLVWTHYVDTNRANKSNTEGRSA